jgi:hypothetical protein
MQTDELIKTNCPTCGAECTVEGKTTHYYVPTLARYREKLLEWMVKNSNNDTFFSDLVKAIESGELEK